MIKTITIAVHFFFYLFISNAQAGQEAFKDCEFSCYFPVSPETKAVYVGNLKIIQKELWVSDFTFFRAECIPANNRIGEKELVNILNIQASNSGLNLPNLKIDDSGQFTIGIYSGDKSVAGQKAKIHGRVIVGNRSLMHLLVIEELSRFPTRETINFLNSFAKK